MPRNGLHHRRIVIAERRPDLANAVVDVLIELDDGVCCAPLLAPALLSFVGFSGSTLLNVNTTLHELSTPLTLASLALLLLSIGLVSHTVAAACRINVDLGNKSRGGALR